MLVMSLPSVLVRLFFVLSLRHVPAHFDKRPNSLTHWVSARPTGCFLQCSKKENTTPRGLGYTLRGVFSDKQIVEAPRGVRVPSCAVFLGILAPRGVRKREGGAVRYLRYPQNDDHAQCRPPVLYVRCLSKTFRRKSDPRIIFRSSFNDIRLAWPGSIPMLKVLEERDLEPVMTKMREKLMSRNVASEVANDITASVQATLIDQKLKSFTRYGPSDMLRCNDALVGR